MSGITTHVLDTSSGHPAIGVKVVLQILSGREWTDVGGGLTDANGRCNSLLGDQSLTAGAFRLLFDAGAYYRELHKDTFYTEIPIVFEVRQPEAHYHVPLLLSPFGYSTYRGS
jgi:5-hydroxyisourate hydrolase